MKKLFTLLTLLVALVTSAWATEETISLASYTVTDGIATLKSTSEKATVILSRNGGNADSPASNSRGFRWQKTRVITVNVASGYKINSVKLTSNSNGNNTGDIQFTLTDGTNALSGSWDNALNGSKATDYTWTASNGTAYTSWVLTNSGTNGDIYFASVTVDYEAYTPTNTAPSFLTQPATTLTAYVGAEASLTVSASGYPTPSIQWYSNTSASNEGGTLIDGATTGTYTFTPNATGTYYYYAVATNNYDDANHTATSNVSTVTVKERGLISYATNDGDATSVPLAASYYEKSSAITLPSVNRYFYKEGYSVSKWNDGTNDYALGASYTVTGDATIAPVFAANTKQLDDEASTITWTFATGSGAPTYTIEGENKTATVISTTSKGIDLKMDVLTTKNGSDVGKFNNSSSTTNAQVNKYTQFTIPAVKGMTVNYTTTTGTLNTTDNVLFGEDHASSISGKNYVYTYNGTAATLTIYDNVGGRYPSGITVTYPEKQTKYLAPTITVGDFSFENKAYPVTITAAEGTLEVSTDGTNYTAQTSPYEVNVTSTTHFYAKAIGASFDDSDVVDENVVCAFDGAKKYVAWVYESNYKNSPNNYAIGSDALHTALADIYNVVDVDIKDYNSAITDAQKTALNGNLDDADLVVISEAAAGGSKALIGLKDIVGTVPMLNMKLFAYTYNSDASKNRWGWGTPKNADKAVVAITPSSKIYKVLEGVTFKGDDIELFAYPNEQNHIQYVDSWETEPAGDVVLATTSSKPAMHASTSQKYFALGLSCDDYTKYNANAVAIVKNAAAMLIAGEALNAEVSSVSVTIAASGYSSLASAYGLNFAGATPAGLEAYVASAVTASGVTLNAVTEAPASTGVILKGTAGTEYTIPVKTDAAAIAGTNYLHAAVAAYNCAADEVYILKGGKFCQVTAASTVPAGKAYLLKSEVDAALAGSAPEYLGFDFGGTTGIKSVDNGQVTVDSSEVYNLAGQRVAQPTKGLYIVNGRKVVIK